jgi:hypothetical protein
MSDADFEQVIEEASLRLGSLQASYRSVLQLQASAKEFFAFSW